MLWKLFGLQRLLDELFDDWVRFDLPRTDGWFYDDTPIAPQD